jgi:hypothetical protein
MTKRKRPFIEELDAKLRELYSCLVDESREFVTELDKDLTFQPQRQSSERNLRPPPV